MLVGPWESSGNRRPHASPLTAFASSRWMVYATRTRALIDDDDAAAVGDRRNGISGILRMVISALSDS